MSFWAATVLTNVVSVIPVVVYKIHFIINIVFIVFPSPWLGSCRLPTQPTQPPLGHDIDDNNICIAEQSGYAIVRANPGHTVCAPFSHQPPPPVRRRL